MAGMQRQKTGWIAMLWLAAGLAIGPYFGHPSSQEPSTGSTARISPAEPQNTVAFAAVTAAETNLATVTDSPGFPALDRLRQLSVALGDLDLTAFLSAINKLSATANWIGSLPSGAPRDAAIRAFVETVDGYDAGLATRWANAIEEPRARQDSVGSAFNRWLESDPANAHAWLANAEMSDEFRTALARAAEARARGRNK